MRLRNVVPQFRTKSGEETRTLGRKLAQLLPRRGLVLLIGDLGAGKTTLAQGIVQGLGAAQAEEVSSPTYTLVHEYGDPVRVYHIDLYRLDSVEQVRGVGYEDILEQDALVLVEWGERFPELFPDDRIEIRLRTLDGDTREISISGLDDLERGMGDSPGCYDESELKPN
jgi:tRNA threonylcarbamoyladenosine biosynthesis protein TsaE